MSGYLARGEDDFAAAEKLGKKQNNLLSFEVTIQIEEVSDFCKLSGRQAVLEGTVSFKPLGQKLPIRNGEFSLFRPERETGQRHMTYSFGFTGNDGNDYFLYGYKVIYDDPHKSDLLEDMTRLFTRIYSGHSAEGPSLFSGILHFRLQSLPSMLASFEVTNTSSLTTKFRTLAEFYTFCYGEIRDTYLAKLSPIYHTEYENLVLYGKLKSENGMSQNFFFFSGIHDKDFPWGDDETFWDIALIIEEADRSFARYVLTDRIIEGLDLDIAEGVYRYEGPIYQVLEGYQVSRSEFRKSLLPKHLRQVHAKVEIHFDYEKYPTFDVPFSLMPNHNRLTPPESLSDIEEWLPHLHTLGLGLTPHRVRVREGKIIISEESLQKEYFIVVDQTLGEAEKSTFKNLRWPKLYYNYFCALNSSSGRILVKIRSDVLRKNRENYLTDKISRELGKMISHLAALDLDISEHGCQRLSAEQAETLQVVEDNLLEINNDHFPTAVFQRRLVVLRDEAGKIFYALEEDMDTLNLGSINSNRVVKVAAIKGSDKFKALDDVLEMTGFYGKLDTAWEQSGKGKEDFSIVVKPNFMFMYSTKDPSTYTDPQLVEHLMGRMFERGYRNLACAEARSTYGVFFTNREVKTVARHIGLTEKNYRIIDLSENLEEYSFSGKLGKHFVNREWKNADFRIAFAKNKTHSYAFYTLTIKNIYGALPMENKFLEYHHRRDIFSTTIEFIKHFPVHFALIDAYISADGPFGIFADKNPNHTETIIGSEDIVATDWIGAAKMGLDPMVSDYIKMAVEAFGKPQIKMIGDRTIYPDWVNVTDVIPLFAFGVLDRYYYFGNLFYSVFAYMEDFFQYKEPSVGRRFARLLADPLKSLFFQKLERGELDAESNQKLYKLFTEEN
ncbi:MAG: DUF362 domain-containing protein [Deltaproteobacteria bacterium]|nr:DUF362 domain-containing protein [Deltaproteobacteria bacterium]